MYRAEHFANRALVFPVPIFQFRALKSLGLLGEHRSCQATFKQTTCHSCTKGGYSSCNISLFVGCWIA